jgi:hypothetical protein
VLFFWRVLDALDYWLGQARLGIIDAVCGPELPTVADEMRERSWAGRFDRAAGADPAAATFAETVGGRSRATVPG